MKTVEKKQSGTVGGKGTMDTLQARLGEENYQKLIKIDNPLSLIHI